jgi:hypothetical protein
LWVNEEVHLEDVNMGKNSNENENLRLLVEYYRSEFRTPENLYYYSPEDLKIAERRFLKFKLIGYEGPLVNEA